MNSINKPKNTLFTLKNLSIIAMCGLFAQISLANSVIVSTVKNPDIYSGNQSWFRYYQGPGTVIKDSVILRNIGNETETISLYPTDATSNQVGSFTPKMQDEEQKGIGLWTKLEKNSVTLAPKENIEVKFEIHIPQDITPGQYFGSIINEEVSDSPCDNVLTVAGSCQGNIQIRTRTGNRVYLTVPGQVNENIKLNSFTWKSAKNNTVNFQFSFTNSGNVAFEPKAVIHIYDSFGTKVDTIEAKLGKSLPGSTITPMTTWDHDGHFGSFTAKAEVFYQEDDQGRVDNLHGVTLSEQSELKIFLFPVIPFLVLSSIILFFIIGWSFRQSFYQKIMKNWESYSVQAGDNLIDLAKERNTNWKLIACINKIKAPYVISPKQKIKIPPKKKPLHEK